MTVPCLATRVYHLLHMTSDVLDYNNLINAVGYNSTLVILSSLYILGLSNTMLYAPARLCKQHHVTRCRNLVTARKCHTKYKGAVGGNIDYMTAFSDSTREPREFWADISQNITWFKPWLNVLDTSNYPQQQW